MRPIQTLAIAGSLFFAALQTFLHAADEKKSASDDATYLTIKLVDEDGAPVARARAGLFVILRNFDEKTGGKWDFIYGVESDSEGIARFHEGEERFKNQRLVYVRHAERQLVCLGDLADQDLANAVRLTMYPECHVSVKLVSSELEQRHRKIERPQGWFLKGTDHRFGCFVGTDSIAHAFLPPGEYELLCDGRNVAPFSKRFTTEPGARQLDLGTIDIPASRIEMLEGRPAPELQGVVEWKNGPAVKLSDLRGKIVLLDFWGWWCGPCVERGIPELFELQKQFHGQNLVIIGIHTPGDESDEINSIAKLDAKLAEVRQRAWKGKDISYPVALTQFQKGAFYDGGPEFAPSKLCSDYGITRFPTSVLIDRAGNVIGTIYPSKPEDREKLKQLLNSK